MASKTNALNFVLQAPKPDRIYRGRRGRELQTSTDYKVQRAYMEKPREFLG